MNTPGEFVELPDFKMQCMTCGNEMAHKENDLFICGSCGLISSNLSPDMKHYDQAYFDKYVKYSQTNVGSMINVTRYEALMNLIYNGFKPKNSGLPIEFGLRVLDYGCGSGSFVWFIKHIIHVFVKGYDIIPNSPYNEQSLLKQQWDIITFWDSLEHLINPKVILENLNPKGVIISVPSTNGSPTEDLSNGNWRHYRPAEHLHYFNSFSLRNFLEACGYKVILKNYRESMYRKGSNEFNILTMGGIKDV